MSSSRLSRRAVAFASATALLGALFAVGAASSASAASAPLSVSLPASPGTHTVTYKATAPFSNGQDGLVYGQLGLDDPKKSCDPSNTTLNTQQRIKVTVPKHINDAYETLIRFEIVWAPPAGNEPASDMALHLFGPDGKLVASSDGSEDREGINLTSATPGTYDMLVCAFQVGPQGQPFVGTVTASTIVPGPYAAAKGVTAPTYVQYEAPKGISMNAGEPSLGNDWKTGHTLFTSNTDVYDVKFLDTKGHSTWTRVNNDPADPSNKVSFDPIGWTDATTGRTFVSQLYLACSGMAYSDDDFKTIHQAEGCGSGVNGFDHQTVGGGPYPQSALPIAGKVYPHAVYYCSQGQGLLLGGVTCARSDTGGIGFGPAVTVYSGACSGIHGHVRVGPEGYVYLPVDKCGGKQGLAVSPDAGMTWTVYQIPDSHSGESDPSVSAGSDGTVYYGYSDGTGEPRVAVSRNHGKTWTRSTYVGKPFGIHNSEFAEMLAGDGDRASFAFLGTKTRGSTQAKSFGRNADGTVFTGGRWDMYVATTYDRGAHWVTVDATPKDPVQRGCIWNSGGSNPCRNLLDFNDITMDKTGHVMVGFADGCVGPDTSGGSDCIASTDVSSNKLVNHGSLVRQMSGKGLLKKYDAPAKKGHAVAGSTATGKGALGSAGSAAAAAAASSSAASRAAAAQAAKAHLRAASRRSPVLPGIAALALVTLAAVAARRYPRRPRQQD